MDFTIPKLFVVPSAQGALPTTNSQALTAGQFGIFLPTHAGTATAPAAGTQYIYFAQGRPEPVPLMGTSKSDIIKPANVLSWLKENGQPVAATQVTKVTAWDNIRCGDTVSVTLRLRSKYIDVSYYNGLTRSVTVAAPCCVCGADPCADVDIDVMVLSFADRINADPILKKYVKARMEGTGVTAALIIDALPLTKYGTSCDLHANPYEFDRMYFWTYVTLGPATANDYATFDPCNQVATVDITQRATYPNNGSEAIQQLEKYWWSYDQPPANKELFRNPNFTKGYKTLVEPNIFYNLYTIKFLQAGTNNGFEDITTQGEQVTIAVPTGNAAMITAIETVLNAYLGTVTNVSPAVLATTTTTTLAPVTTTTTTKVIP